MVKDSQPGQLSSMKTQGKGFARYVIVLLTHNGDHVEAKVQEMAGQIAAAR